MQIEDNHLIIAESPRDYRIQSVCCEYFNCRSLVRKQISFHFPFVYLACAISMNDMNLKIAKYLPIHSHSLLEGHDIAQIVAPDRHLLQEGISTAGEDRKLPP